MRKVLRKMLSYTIVFIIGAITFTTIGVVAATEITASQVDYTNNNQSTVDGALDDLYTKANTYIKPSDYYIVFSSSKRIMANALGICVRKGQFSDYQNRSYCFAAYNSGSEENSDRFENEVRSNFESWGGSCSWSGGFGFSPNYILTCTDNYYFTLTFNSNTANWTVESVQNEGEKCEYKTTFSGYFLSVSCS